MLEPPVGRSFLVERVYGCVGVAIVGSGDVAAFAVHSVGPGCDVGVCWGRQGCDEKDRGTHGVSECGSEMMDERTRSG